MFSGSTQIRDAYRDERVADRYVAERFCEPLGALLHARQVAYLRRVLHQLKPHRVLEIAPGPARLTADVAPFLASPPVLVDASAQMLAQAKRRLAAVAEPATLVQGDVFQLPFGPVFDCVYTFRLIRHFGTEDRPRLYTEIARVLRPGGVLLFDAVNEEVSGPLRLRSDPNEHRHYDALLNPEALKRELEQAGFTMTSLQGVQHRYPVLAGLQVLVAPRSRLLARGAMEIVDRVGNGAPLEWIVNCCRA
jgi:SAM-dependent methyltransferase